MNACAAMSVARRQAQSSSPAQADSSAAISSSTLVREGARVRAMCPLQLAQRPRNARLARPGSSSREVDVVLGELRDVESVRTPRSQGADVVFHLGAQIAIPYSYVNPRDFFETNVLGTLNVAQAALRRRRRSASCTRRRARSTAPRGPCRSPRTHPLEPQSPYAASKVAADKLIDSYHRSFDLPVTVAAAVQHLRPAPVGARGDPDDHRPGARRGRAAARLAGPPPRPHLRRRHGRGFVAAADARRRGRAHDPARHRPRRLDRRPRRHGRRRARPDARRSRPIRPACGPRRARSSA